MGETATNLTALLDQHGAFLSQVADVLGQYMAALAKAGFTRDEAIMLVIEYQGQFFDEIERARRKD